MLGARTNVLTAGGEQQGLAKPGSARKITPRFFPRRLQSKIIVLTTAALFMVGGIQLWFSLQEHERLYRNFVLSTYDSLSDNMSEASVELMLADSDPFELTALLLSLDRYESVKHAAIFNQDNALVAHYINPRHHEDEHNPAEHLQQLQALTAEPLGMSLANRSLMANKRIGDEGYPLGRLILALDYEMPLLESRRELIRILLPFVLALIVIVSLLAFWFHSLAFRPLVKLSDFARRVSHTGDYSTRIRLTGNDEVSLLGQNISDMMDTIEGEYEENKRQNNRLLKQQQAMEQLANYDSLTGLPNRQCFMEMVRVELARAKRAERNLVIMFCDLDGFKSINDAMGHETGDLLLVEACNIIRSQLREGDVLARLGGDEFLILLSDQPDEVTIVGIANRIINKLNQPIPINGWDANIGTSIGIAHAEDCDFSLSAFISNADIAMYQSKSAGRGTYTIFHKKMLEESRRKLDISNHIMQAAENDEFYVLYQPKIGTDRKVKGFEALIRWTNPVLGAVYPDEFINIAEKNGKINELTRWIIKRVFADIAHIKSFTGEQAVVAINLSAYDVSSSTLIDFIQQQLDLHNVQPSNIEFEITETVYLDNFDMADDFLKKISAMGFSIALDDFGTGYSSLSYLTRLQLNSLKIDKQFIDSLGVSDQDFLIVQTIVEMASALNLRVVAEGVETWDQYHYLMGIGCEQVQGYLFAKPTALVELPVCVAKLNA